MLLGSLLLGVGCADDGGVVDRLFPEDISLVELDRALEQPQRVRVGLDEDFPQEERVVDRVLVRDQGRLDEEEHLEGEISDFSFQGGRGTVTVLGGVQVAFDESTRFRSDDDFGEDDELTMQEFVDRLNEAFAQNEVVSIEADSMAPAEPAAPDAMSFFAERLEIDDEGRDARLAVNMDRDNLTLDPMTPDATIRAFGVDFPVVEGRTEIEAVELPDGMRTVDFQGEVADVNTEAGLLFLEDGRIIRVSPNTQMGDPRDPAELQSLQEIQDALARGERVMVNGEGLREDGANEITAMEIEARSGVDRDGDGFFDEPNGF